jgi:hypothetical protein
VIITRGGVTADFRSLLMGRCAARVSRRRWTMPMMFARDRHDDFVEMPLVAAGGCALADQIGECLAELFALLAHGLVGHANPARRQQLFDHAKAQGKPEIEPNGIADHLRREAMTAIERVTRNGHRRQLADRPDAAFSASTLATCRAVIWPRV